MCANGFKNPDETLIINLHQQYYVEYKAATKRLRELRNNVIHAVAKLKSFKSAYCTDLKDFLCFFAPEKRVYDKLIRISLENN